MYNHISRETGGDDSRELEYYAGECFVNEQRTQQNIFNVVMHQGRAVYSASNEMCQLIR